MVEPGSDLSSLPALVQISIGAVIALGSFLVWFLNRKKEPEQEGNNTAQGIYRTLLEMRSDNARFANERNQKLDKQTDLLSDIRNNQNRRTR